MDIYDRYERPAMEYTDTTEDKGLNYNPVSMPAHYANKGLHGGDKYNMECIDWIQAESTPEEFNGYLKGCALKYIWRYKDKGNRVEDLEKAQWYLNKLSKQDHVC